MASAGEQADAARAISLAVDSINRAGVHPVGARAV